MESQVVMWEGGWFWPALLGLAPGVVLGAAWLIAAVLLVWRDTHMEKATRLAQLYGYTVCLIALVVSLVTGSSILGAAIDRANPLQSEFAYGAALTSFEAYVATYQRGPGAFAQPGAPEADTASARTLRTRYDALVADRLASTRYRTTRTFITSGALLVVALALFAFHWRWVRRLSAVV